jgi:hypothetical protein
MLQAIQEQLLSHSTVLKGLRLNAPCGTSTCSATPAWSQQRSTKRILRPGAATPQASTSLACAADGGRQDERPSDFQVMDVQLPVGLAPGGAGDREGLLHAV